MQAVQDAGSAIVHAEHRAPENNFSQASSRTLAESIAELNFVVRHQPRIAAGVLAYWLEQSSRD